MESAETVFNADSRASGSRRFGWAITKLIVRRRRKTSVGSPSCRCNPRLTSLRPTLEMLEMASGRVSLADIAGKVVLDLWDSPALVHDGREYKLYSYSDFESLLLAEEMYSDVRSIRTKWKAFKAIAIETVHGKDLIDLRRWNARFPSAAFPVEGEGVCAGDTKPEAGA